MAIKDDAAIHGPYAPTVIVGLGNTGLSCLRYLVQQGATVAITDSRAHPPGLATCQMDYPQVPVAVGALSESMMAAAQQLVVSPGVSCREPAIAKQIVRGVSLLGDVELFARENQRPVLAVTGSNGKTTVTTLLAQMVQAAGYNVEACGNIGRPVLDVLLDTDPDYFVLELSSFQLQVTDSLSPKVAVLLNVTPDHLDRHEGFADYLAAKQRIYRNAEMPVVNWDEPNIWKTVTFQSDPIGFTLRTPKPGQFGVRERAGHCYLAQGQTLLVDRGTLPLQGRHHDQNALAALAVGSAIGLPMDTMVSTLQSFRGMAHRCERVSEQDAVRWINDSKATNIGAAIAAIQTVSTASKRGRLLLIAGGDAKGVDLSPLRAPVQQAVSQVWVYGRDAAALTAVLADVVPCERVDSLEDAVQAAANQAQPGDTVLFSPACSSLDEFDNYEHRGRVFVEAVLKCVKNRTPSP